MPANPAKAVEYFQRAAQEGDAEGMYRLALCYAEGRAVEADPARALRLCQEALDSDDLEDEEDAALRQQLEGLLQRLRAQG